ncbi:hypothetical protein ACEQUB_00364 [Ralstonia syzygii]
MKQYKTEFKLEVVQSFLAGESATVLESFCRGSADWLR